MLAFVAVTVIVTVTLAGGWIEEILENKDSHRNAMMGRGRIPEIYPDFENNNNKKG